MVRSAGVLLAEAKWPVAGIVALSVLGAASGIGVLAVVNHAMAEVSAGGLASTLWVFAALLALTFATTAAARTALHMVGHRFVYRLRRVLVKRVLDTDIEQLERIGGARLITMLDADIRNVTIAFVHLPELLYGIALCIAALAYLAVLSLPLFVTTALWLAVLAVVGWLIVGRIDHHICRLREDDDRLHADYLAIIEGRKELALNRHRAQRLYEEEFDQNARSYRHHVTRADTYNGLIHTFANTMVLGLIGVVFYLAVDRGWADVGVAATYALTILFLRAPLVGAVAGVSALIAAQVSLDKINALVLAPHRGAFGSIEKPFAECREVALHQALYRYEAEGGSGFAVGPLSLTIRRGEIVFVIGGNGSGKSTLARLLTGLYPPQQGCTQVDGVPVDGRDRQAYRHLFSAVFSDFHLFRRLLTGSGEEVAAGYVQHWLQRLGMERKTGHDRGRLASIELSQGQRKRLALLLAILEQRDFLVLDECAADQDPQFRRFFYEALLPELRAAGKAVVAITHDDRYFGLADRIVKMDGGQLIEVRGDERARASADVVQAIGIA